MDVQTDRELIRATGKSRRYLLLRLRAPEPVQATKRPPINVAIVLDRSGSMHGAKLRLAKDATRKALGLLGQQDRFSLVVYDNAIDVLVESTTASTESLDLALRKLDAVAARGSTDLGTGWLKGCEQVAAHLADEAVGRCLLLTDGLANVGITSQDALAQHAEQLRARHVVTSTFGVGADFDERLLAAMARAGGGNFYYIEAAAQIPDFLTSELGEALEIVARDLRLDVSAPEAVALHLLSDFRSERQGTNLACFLPDLIARQEITLVVEACFPQGHEGDRVDIECSVHDREKRLSDAPITMAWTFADHAASDRQPRNLVVDRAVARLHAAIAQRDAVEANRRGDYVAARSILENVAKRIEGYAGGDAELRQIARGLRELVGEFAESMDGASLKRRHFASSTALRSRDMAGKARKH
jgi:Ca-activated chloride channel family protein